MFKSSLRQKWKAGQTTVNGWLSIANTFSTEVMAAQDYDSLTVDLQHGVIGYEASVQMIQVMRGTKCAPIVRVPWRSAGDIMKALDLGIEAIICPMVNNKAEAEELASFCRYPPRGQRSFGPTRAIIGIDPAYYETANDDVIVLAMIETGEALENVEEIVATDGIDGVYIGPSDLTLGVTNGRLSPAQDREEPEMLDAIHRILKAAKDAGKYACLHTASPEYAAKGAGWGFDMVTIGSDSRNLATESANSIKQFRELAGQKSSDGVIAGY